MNRTLVETTRSMLLDAELPQTYWAEALMTAAYLRNRSPTAAVEGMTPFQAWSGKKPGVSHLRVFGYAGYVHVPKDRRSKLDSKTQKCIMLGYGTVQKGYRLFDYTNRKIVHSRNVRFNEQEMGNPIVPREESPTLTLLDLDADEPEKIDEETTQQRTCTQWRSHAPEIL